MANLPPLSAEIHDWICALKNQINSPDFQSRFSSFYQSLIAAPEGGTVSFGDIGKALDVPEEVADLLFSVWSLAPGIGATSIDEKVVLQ